jgi:3-oxoacyl-[acyl-carrier protein] reductase
MNKANIKGKWALVTGASRGIGKQVCLGLAKHGCNVVLHSRDISHTSELAKELESHCIQTQQIAADLGNSEQVSKMVAELSTGPNIDIVYNNAAIMTQYCSDWLNVPSEDLRVSFEVNVTALMKICHAFIPGMVDRGWGRIINVTSGIADQPELIAYAVSKAAVDKFVLDSVGKLEGTGVLMNLLDPGWLRTDLGGPNAPNSVESVLPGALVPALIEDGTSGKLFRAQDYAGTEI